MLTHCRDASKNKSRGLSIIISLTLWIGMLGGCTDFLDPSLSFTLNFPKTVGLGELRLTEDVNCFTCGTGNRYLGQATGSYDIRLPAAHWFVSLKMPKDASRLLPYLAEPSLANIGDIDLHGSDVKDDDLKYVAAIRLRSIDLSKTGITGAGLKYLRPNDHWIFVELRDCERLDPQYLSHFKGWKRSTIRLVPYKSTGEVYSERELRLLNIAREVICNGQPEDMCGTQIR